MKPLSVAVLISGRGSNMSSLVEASREMASPARIVLVVSDRREASGLVRAEQAGIATRVVQRDSYTSREAFEAELDRVLTDHGVELACLAGFMRVLTPTFCERWKWRILNIHPSLLPAFKGLETHARAIAAGARIHGCTVHYVTPELDAGPIIAQAAVPILPSDTPERLAERVLSAEHRLYPHALTLVASGQVRVAGGRVLLDSGVVESPPLFSPSLRS